jgi:hypothetical protein
MPLAHRPAPRRFVVLALLLFGTYALVSSLAPSPAHATFHLMQITKVMAGFEGDEAIEAVEMEMLADGQNLVDNTFLRVYNAAGVPGATLGTFNGNIAVGLTGRKVLIATMKFKQRFGITPDLQINAGIPGTTGQVAFEAVGCMVNALAYGNVTVPVNGPTSAPRLPILGATALDRGINGNATFPSCPLGENAGARFAIYQGYAGHPIRFTNNAGVFVDVTSAVTAVEPATPAPLPLRASPNPFQHATDIEFSGAPGRVLVHDVQGRLVRSWEGASATGGRLRWDGTDAAGKTVASGIYFVRMSGGGSSASAPLRIVLLR